MKWIRVEDRLPDNGEYCWLYGNIYGQMDDSYVFEGRFNLKSHDFRSGRRNVGPGWEHEPERSDFVMTDQVSHWMPYYTPEPPKDED